MPSYVVCARCQAQYPQPDPGTGSEDALQAFGVWVTEHQQDCPRPPAALILTQRARAPDGAS